MAMTGVLRPGFVQVRVLDLEAAVEHYAKRIGMHEVARGADGRVYLKCGDEFDHHSVVLRPADRAGLDYVAYKVASEADLDSFAKRITDYGVAIDHVSAGEQPGIGRRIGFTVPAGHRFELYAHADRSEPGPDVHNPDVWSVEPHGMGATRFDHVLLYGPNVDETVAFFETCLDFKLSERLDPPDGLLAAFLTCGMKAHDVAFVKHDEPGKLHHISFNLESWNDVGHAADIITRYDISVDIGPTRHGITRGQTIYFFDPSGNRNEVFSGGYTYYPDSPTRTWDVNQIGKSIFYYERQLNENFLSVVT
ncbi:catechol 2,3-dioxygenase [Acidocella sp.]|uniref:catechol 2,3-dioxygenase n=2 Tax=Acidocella sp. TaxID=50710 RepID=UPI002617B32B|nr:catechol 2,3-dioxygenase [Acidocella sp.]